MRPPLVLGARPGLCPVLQKGAAQRGLSLCSRVFCMSCGHSRMSFIGWCEDAASADNTGCPLSAVLRMRLCRHRFSSVSWIEDAALQARYAGVLCKCKRTWNLEFFTLSRTPLAMGCGVACIHTQIFQPWFMLEGIGSLEAKQHHGDMEVFEDKKELVCPLWFK